MIADTLTLSQDSPTDVDTNTTSFVRRYGDAGKSEFSVAGYTLPTEQKLLVSHETDKNGVHGALVKLSVTDDDALGIVGTSSVAFTIRRANNSYFTEALLLQMCFRIIDFLIEGGAGANITKLLNKET